MKKGLMVVVLMSFLLVGCGKEEENIVIASMDSLSPTITNPAPSGEENESTPIQETTNPTTKKIINKDSNFYIEVESKNKEKRRYTFVYKSFDECQAKGKEFLSLIQQIHPEIVKSDCMYLKDDRNNRYWGVIFQTCNDPSTICNFYY